MHEYDKSSKWLIQHHGDSILRLAGVRDIAEWRPLQAEIVQPRRLPDGLIEVRRQGQSRDRPRSCSRWRLTPRRGLPSRLSRDMALVFLDRGILPEMLVLVLHPKGNQQVAGSAHLQSACGWTRLQSAWKVVELWTVPAEDLLAAGDVGMIPWVPLGDIGMVRPSQFSVSAAPASTRMPFPASERTCWPSRRYWPVCGMMIRDCFRSWEDEKP